MKLVIFTLFTLLLSSCGLKTSTNGSVSKGSGSFISGVVSPFAGFISSNNNSLFIISNANAVACNDSVYAKLFLIESDGSINEANPLDTQLISADARYSFDVNALKLTESSTVKYLVRAEGCNDDIYKRPVTGFDESQNIDAKTTVVSEVVNSTGVPKTLNIASRVEVENLIKSLSGTSVSAALASLTNKTENSEQFISIFGVAPTVIQNAKPEIRFNTPGALLNELAVNNFSVQAIHVNPNYSFAYRWKLDGVVKSTSSQFNYIPGANDSGVHSITLYVGQSDNNGGIDEQQPFYIKNFDFHVNNNISPVAPAFVLSSTNPTPVNSTSISIDINTGMSLSNCGSFSALAITDSATPPGIMQFILHCSISGTQVVPVNFTAGEGNRSLYLWAIDNEGVVSLPASRSFVLDSLPPTAALNLAETVLKGGSSHTVTLSASDAGTGVSSLALYFSVDGVAASSLVATLPSTATSYSWTVPAVNTTSGELKLVATDGMGTSTTSRINSLTIDSTPPTAPGVTRVSASITNSTDVTMTVASCTDTAQVRISEVNFAPLASSTGWINCSTAAGAYNLSVAGNGVHNIYVWAKDVVGNVAISANNISMTLDTVSPIITITTLAPLKGNSNTGNLSWTLTEGTIAASTTFSISIFDGASWIALPSKAATAGVNTATAYSLTNFTVPNVNTTLAKVRLAISDAAGNSTTTESNTFTIDSTSPVMSSLIINDNAIYAGTAVVNVKAAMSDNLSSATQLKIRLALANSTTSECQSEYADDQWINWTNSTTNIPFNFSPTDGEKKICAWAKDITGNISVISPSVGTQGINVDTIIYSTGNPPEISSFSVFRTSDNGTTAYGSDLMTISWTAKDIEGLDNNPISFSYTTDNNIWKDITTNLDSSINENITWMGSVSGNPTTASGTILTWRAPGASNLKPYFRVRAISRDVAGNTSQTVNSQVFNTDRWSVYAGSINRGDGGTGKAAALYGSGYYSHFAINPLNGDMYAIDSGKGIRKLDAKTGIVSTFLKHGTLNLSTNGGALPANPAMPLGAFTNIVMDNKGRMYLSISNSAAADTAIMYQIDIENSTSRIYAGGGTANDGGALSTALQIAPGGYNFDEQNSLYVWTFCGDAYVTALNYTTVGQRIVKISQNADGTPGTTTRVIGTCSFGAITSGAAANGQPAMSASSYALYSGIIPWDNGNKIVVLPYGGSRYKIINGIAYSSNIAANYSTGIGKYNPADGLLYKSNATGIEKVSINTSGANGEVSTQHLTSNSTSPGCTSDGVSNTSYCALILAQFQVHSGIVYFPDGAGQNASSNYSIRYLDSSNKVRTVFGSQPFYGDGQNKSLMRGSFSGIYYKKSSEDNLDAFPEGLYFVERAGLVFGHINPTNGEVKNLWGNQSRAELTNPTGTTINKNLSMGKVYTGNGYTLTFDKDGLPWLRVSSEAISIDENNKIVRKSNRSLGSGTNLQALPGTANPSFYDLYVYGGYQNFTLKNNGLFIFPNYVTTGINPPVTMRYFDYENGVSPVVVGGNYLANSNQAASPNVTVAGTVKDAPLWTGCKSTGYCYVQYNEHNDRVYFAENTKIRYITTPDNPATSVMGTEVTSTTAIYNLSFTPDGSQLWYLKSNGGLYCHDISSGKSWCNDTDDHFTIRTASGLSVGTGPNQFTFKDNQTMFLSTYNGEILQFDLPTTP